MNHALRISAWTAAVVVALACGQVLFAQDPAAKGPTGKPAAKAAPAKATAKAKDDAKPAAKVPVATGPTSVYRPLSPGVLQVPYQPRPLEETVSRQPAVELLAIDMNFDWAKDVPFRHDVWMLDFSFKPVRMMWVDIPGTAGRMERKLVWYMIYTVKNPGKIMHPVEVKDGIFKVKLVNDPVRCIPSFTLEAHDRLKDDAGFTKAYEDKYIPLAFAPIAAREDPKRKFFNPVDMARKPIEVGEERWGIVTWENIDPRNVWFSIYIEGLTNAYRYTDDPTKYVAKTLYRTMFRKALKLNFWRPGDEFTETESQIRYGAPGKPDFEWVWRRVF